MKNEKKKTEIEDEILVAQVNDYVYSMIFPDIFIYG